MGGNAIKTSQRMSKTEYFEIARSLDYHGMVVPAYSEKETFGDLDCLISDKNKHSLNKKQLLINAGFTVTEEIKNTNVTSFGVKLKDKIFQIDVISHPEEILMFAYNYYSFNDLGNLIGRLARSIGLKFGHYGLTYTQRDKNGTVLKDHLLTLNFGEALGHLGLNPARYYEGFKNLQEIFEYVISSKYYDFARFDLSQRNSSARRRDQNRPTYNKFLTFVKEQNIQNNLSGYGTNPATYLGMHLGMHFDKFEGLKEAYNAELLKAYYQNQYKRKFSGTVVKKVTGLDGKELGVFMKDIKEEFPLEYVLRLSETEIIFKIKQLFKESSNEC